MHGINIKFKFRGRAGRSVASHASRDRGEQQADAAEEAREHCRRRQPARAWPRSALPCTRRGAFDHMMGMALLLHGVLALAAAAVATAAPPIGLATSPVAKPTTEQRAWQDLEVGPV